jgi:FkbM family methyltransferase
MGGLAGKSTEMRDAAASRVDVLGPPLLFRVARGLIRKNIRGGYRLMDLAERYGVLNRLVHYPISNGISMRVPIWRPENRWDRRDVMDYERELIACVESRIRRPSALIDCGAEIGIFSISLFARSRMITRVIAVEPNAGCMEALTANIESLPVPAEVVAGAIGSEPGWGTLCNAEESMMEYALYMESAATGKTRVFTIDQLDLPGDEPVVVKLDVEGWEGEAIKGATRTLMSRDFVLTVEANHSVYHRTKVDPCAVLKLVPRIRDCELVVAEEPGTSIDLDRPFLEQFPQLSRKTLNVVASHWTRIS